MYFNIRFRWIIVLLPLLLVAATQGPDLSSGQVADFSTLPEEVDSVAASGLEADMDRIGDFEEELLPATVAREPISMALSPSMRFQPAANAHHLNAFKPQAAVALDLAADSADLMAADMAGNTSAMSATIYSPKRDAVITLQDEMMFHVEGGTFDQPIALELVPELEYDYDDEISLSENHVFRQFEVNIVNQISGEIHHNFEQPVRMIIDLRAYGIDLNEHGGYFYMAYEDPDNPGTYTDVPTVVHQGDGLISAETTHFSNWISGWRPESWTLDWRPPTVSEFTGAATFTYPIGVPPGRGGLQPNVALSYSSSSLSGAIQQVSSGTIAAGWSIPDINITRIGTESRAHGKDYFDEFRLVINGVGHRLVRWPGTKTIVDREAIVFYAEGAPSIRVENYGGLRWNNNRNHHNYWIVRTGDGMSYRLGFTNNHNYAPYNNPSVTFQQTKLGANGDITTEAVAWHVDTVTDPYGNQMLFQYQQVTRFEELGYWCPNTIDWNGGVCYLKVWDHTAQLSEILYNYPDVANPHDPVPVDIGRLNTGSAQPGSRIKFNYGAEDRLSGIDIYHGVGLPQIRHYAITATNLSFKNPYQCDRRKADGNHVTRHTTTRVVSKIQEFVGSNALPATEFFYDQYSHLAHQGVDCFSFYYLGRVTNGYGGASAFKYEHDGRKEGDGYTNCRGWQQGDDPCEERFPAVGYNYYVTDIYHNDNIKDSSSWNRSAARTQYAYENTCYNQTATPSKIGTTNCPLPDTKNKYGNIGGFGKVIVTKYDFNNQPIHRTITQRYQDPNRFGKPYVQRSGPPNLGNPKELVTNRGSRIETAYETTHFRISVPFTYVSEVKTFHMNGLEMSSKVRYRYAVESSHQINQDNFQLQLGEITHVDLYDDANANLEEPYQTIKRYSIANFADGYWVIRTKSEGVYDSTKNTLQNKWFYFDQETDLSSTAAAKLRNGTLLRQRVGDPISCPDVSISNCASVSRTIDKTYAYDGFGNIRSESSFTDYGYFYKTVDGQQGDIRPQNSLSTSITYDPAFNLYPIATTNAKGQTSTFEIWGFGSALTGFQRQTGLLKKVTNSNGVSMLYEYDPFGRLYEIYEGHDTAGFGDSNRLNGNPTTRYSYFDNSWMGSYQIDPLNDQLLTIQTEARPALGAGNRAYYNQSVSYFDGFGREIQSQSRLQAVDGGANNQTIVITRGYDSLGQIICETVPFSITNQTTYYEEKKCDDSSLSSTQTIFDYQKIGRSTITTPDGNQTQSLGTINTQTASGDVIDSGRRFAFSTIIDAENNARASLTNNRGQLSHVIEYGELNSGGSYRDVYAITEYNYDELGNLDQVIDAKGNETRMTYDGFGHKIEMIDPDMGDWVYLYDAQSNLIQQRDAKGQALCFWYDDLNRMTTKAQYDDDCPAAPPSQSSEAWLASWTYDTAANGIGQLAVTEWRGQSGVDRESFTYDSLGRLTSQTRIIAGESFTMGYSAYDDLNRPTKMTYPDGDVVTMTYDRMGEDKLSSSHSGQLVSQITHNAQGQVTRFIRGSGTSDAIVDTIYQYYPASENYRMHKILHGSEAATGNNPADYTFTYDNVGNITSFRDSSEPKPVEYEYDFLYRLSNTSNLYVRSYAYDEIGNMINKNGMILNYDSTQPHAVDSTAGGGVFKYDANGNMRERQEENGGNYLQSWDGENRLSKVTDESTGETTQFFYDPTGQRTMTVEPDGTQILYPFANYEVEIRGLPTPAPAQLDFWGRDEQGNIYPDKIDVEKGNIFYLEWDSQNLSNCQGTGEWELGLEPDGSIWLEASRIGLYTFNIECETSDSRPVIESMIVEVIEPTVTPEPILDTDIEAIQLIDVATNSAVHTLPREGQATINLAAFPEGINLAIEAADRVNSVRILYDLTHVNGNQFSSSFLTDKNSNGSFAACRVESGIYSACIDQNRLKADRRYDYTLLPFGGNSGNGAEYRPTTITLVMIDDPSRPAVETSGGVPTEPTATPVPPTEVPTETPVTPEPPTVTPEPVLDTDIEAIRLIDVASNSTVHTLPREGQATINLAAFPEGINLAIDAADGVNSVRIQYDLTHVNGNQFSGSFLTDKNSNGSFAACRVESGIYSACIDQNRLKADRSYDYTLLPFGGNSGNGVEYRPTTITLVMIDDPSRPAVETSGGDPTEPTATPEPPTEVPTETPVTPEPPTVTPEPVLDTDIEAIRLIDVASNSVVHTLPREGQATINLAAFPEGINLAIDAADGVNSVRILYDLTHVNGNQFSGNFLTDKDSDGSFAACRVENGIYSACIDQNRLKADRTYDYTLLPFGGNSGNGTAYRPTTITLIMIDDPNAAPVVYGSASQLELAEAQSENHSQYSPSLMAGMPFNGDELSHTTWGPKLAEPFGPQLPAAGDEIMLQTNILAASNPVRIIRKTYSLAGQPVATVVKGNPDVAQNGLFYIYTDHLGSANTLADSNGNIVDIQKFYPFGEYRNSPDKEITNRGFTGHRENREIGLTYMNARYYVPGLGRFLTADSIVPEPANPQAFNRYSYVYNNPINLIDPTGHCGADLDANGNRDEALFNRCEQNRNSIQNSYGVIIKGTWFLEEILKMVIAFERIDDFFITNNDNTGVDTFAGIFDGTIISRVDLACGWQAATACRNFSGSIEIGDATFINRDGTDRDQIDVTGTFAHELAHVWDASENNTLSEGLQDIANGHYKCQFMIFGCRYVAEESPARDQLEEQGNRTSWNPKEDFAYTFQNLIVDPLEVNQARTTYVRDLVPRD